MATLNPDALEAAATEQTGGLRDFGQPPHRPGLEKRSCECYAVVKAEYDRLLADEPKTLQEVADHYGLTRERARQIEAKVIQKLREFLRGAVDG